MKWLTEIHRASMMHLPGTEKRPLTGQFRRAIFSIKSQNGCGCVWVWH